MAAKPKGPAVFKTLPKPFSTEMREHGLELVQQAVDLATSPERLDKEAAHELLEEIRDDIEGRLDCLRDDLKIGDDE